MCLMRSSEKVVQLEIQFRKIESSLTCPAKFINFVSKNSEVVREIGSSTVNREKFRKKMVQRDVQL